MTQLSHRMIQRILPATKPVVGTITFRRSAILKLLRRAHGPAVWEFVPIASDGCEYRCIQCGRARNKNSGRRCRQCFGDNAVCKVMRPGPRGELLAVLLEGESKGMFEMVSFGLWITGNAGTLDRQDGVG